jgi:hypothetical protein
MPKANEIQEILDARRATNRKDPIARRAALLNIFEMLKVSLSNTTYWSHRLKNMRLVYYSSEILTGLCAASAVTTLPIWKTNSGRLIWLTIAVILAFLTTLKAVLKIPATLDDMSQKVSLWRSVARDLQEIAGEHSAHNLFQPELWEAYSLVRRRYLDGEPVGQLESSSRAYRVSESVVSADPKFSWIDKRIRELRQELGNSGAV